MDHPVNRPFRNRAIGAAVMALVLLASLSASLPGLSGGGGHNGVTRQGAGTPPVTGRDIPATPPGPSQVLPHPAQLPAGVPMTEPKRVAERIGDRTANTKVFQLADGRIQAEVASQPAHYRDANGRWQDIDTRVVPDATSGYRYGATRNSYTSRFGTSTDHLVSYSFGGRSVRLGLDGEPRPAQPTVEGNRVTYRDIAGDADLVYEVTAGALKEKLILDRAPADATYTFVLTLDGVDPVQQPDGSIAFHASGADGPPLFYLPAPFMFDDRDDARSPYGKRWSDKVTQTLRRDGDRATLTVRADAEWLRSKDRKYPVVIDPTIKLQPTVTQSQDAMIVSDGPTSNYDGSWRLSVGTTTAAMSRSLLKFDLSTLPAGTQLDAAQLQLYFDQTHTTDATAVTVEARRVTANWAENTVTWNSANAAFAEAGFNREPVDNTDAGKVAASGEWPSTTDANAQNGSYQVNRDATTGNTFTWVPRITETGNYTVEVRYVAGTDRATAAPYSVTHAGGTTTVNVDQTAGTGGVWKSIGTWNFNAGTTHKIVLGDVAGKAVIADSVRLTKNGTAVKTANQSNVWHTFSVRSTVQDWLDGRQTNHGFMLKAANEALNQGGPRYEAAEYAYNGEHENTPKLLLTYGRPGVKLATPTTIRATGADLSWAPYVDPSTAAGDDLVEYQIHRSIYQNFMPSAATLIAPIAGNLTTYTDTTAVPTAADSAEPFGNAYYYVVAVKTRDGTIVPSQTELVRLPKAGQVVRVFQDAVDTTLSKTEATTGHDVLAGNPWLMTGNNSGTYGVTRVLTRFPNLSNIPAGAKVQDAELQLWGWTTYGSGATYEARGLTRDFDEATASWTQSRTGTAWSALGADMESTFLDKVSNVTNDPAWRAFSAGPLVQRWINDPTSNKGAVVKLVDETTPQERTLFMSAEAAEPQLRPKLWVLYTEPTSVSTYHAPTTPDRMIPGEQYVVPVTLTNTTNSPWSATDYVLSYHWELPDGTDVTNSGNQRETPLPATLNPGGVVTVNATVMTPIRSDAGNKREAFVLKWDLRNRTTGTWLSTSAGIPPLAQNITVEDPTSDQLGLEKFYQYTGKNAGSGSTVMVNQFSGNAVFSYNPFTNPSRGVATFLRVTYNSQDTSKNIMGYGWSLSASSVMRLGSPVQFRGNNQWPLKVDLTDGDGTTHFFTLNKHGSTNSADWTYDKPAGVHLHLQRTGSTDPLREWVMTRPDRTQIFFDGQGYQTAVRDKNGNELLFTYERKQVNNRNMGVLKYLTDPASRQTLTLEYYAKGDTYQYYSGNVKLNGTNLNSGLIVDNLKSVTDVSGRKLLFIYSDKGQLQEIADGSGTTDVKPFVFFYDDTVGAHNAKLLRIQDPRGNSTRIAYYPTNAGQLLRLRTQVVTDRMGKSTTFNYTDPDGTAGTQISSTVTDANNRVSTYLLDGYGRTTKFTNAKNELTELTWDADHNVRRLAEPNNAITTWVYDPNTGYPLETKDAEANKNGTAGTTLGYRFGLGGHTAELTSKTTPEGRKWTFGYDTFGNLTSVTDPKGTATPIVGDFTRTYTYDPSGQLLTETDANERVTRYTSYEANGYPQTITDALNFPTLFTYDARGNVLSVVDARGKKSEYTYDVFGRSLVSKEPKDAAAGVFITTPAPKYDKNDNITEETLPTGAIARAGYDATDRMTFSIDPPDTATSPERRTTFGYDNVGNLTSETEPKGNLTPTIAGDFTTTYLYDELNRVIRATDANAGSITFTYDNVGNLVTEADQVKNATADPADFNAKYTYDLNHRLTVTTDAAGFTTKNEYDRDGNIVGTVDQENNRTITVYDQRAAVIAEKVPHRIDNGVITYRTTAYEYDEVGNRTKVITPRGVDTTDDPDDFALVTVYDAVNQVKEEWQAFDRDDSRYTTPEKTIYSYDGNGNVTQISSPPSQGQTTRAVTTNTYWDTGWLRTTTDPWNIRTEFDYDALGDQTLRKGIGTDGAIRNQRWTYFPDGKKRTHNDDGAASSTARKDVEYSYDPNGNLDRMLDRSTDAKIDAYVVTYDGLNRVGKIEEKLGTTLKNTSTFEYEPNDNLRKRTHDREITEYTYDTRDLPSRVVSRKSATDTGPKTFTFEYTARVQTRKETKANNNTVEYEYYLDQSMRRQVEKKSSGAVVNEHTIDYDANGNRSKDVARKQNADNKVAFLDTTTTYEYDPLDRIRRLTKTGHGAGTETYVHDANSNVIEQTVASKTTTFNYDRNRLVSSSTAGISSNYEYDAWGRLTRVVAAGIEVEKYTYDGFDRTVSHTSAAGGTTTYKYDALDRQVSRTRGGKTTDLIYLGLTENVLAEEENGQLRKLYQYGPDGELLSQENTKTDGSKENSYHSYNPHTDIEQITNEQGDSRATYGYTAYGKNDDQQFTGVDKPDPANPEDPNKEAYNVYRYNSKRFDQATGDYDMGFRDYDPGLNRFLARDAYNGALNDLNLTTDPFTNNRYAFAGGNPISNVELDGHISLSDIGHAALDVAGLVPGVGEVADLANAAWYAAEGDYGNAALSAAAAIPFAGYAASAAKGVKYAAKGVDAAQTASRAADSAKTAGRAADTAQGAGRAAPSTPKGSSAGAPGPAKAGTGPSPAKAGGGSTPRAGGCNSFVAGTPVLMADGSRKPIELVRLGDRVLATDPQTGRSGSRAVIALIPGNGDKQLVELDVDVDGDRGDAVGTVVATDEHPFWIDNRDAWVDAEDVRAGDEFRTAAGGQVRVLAHRSWRQQQAVYNFTVADLHTYFVSVGTADVLVHNDSCPFDDLAKYREREGMPKAGSPEDAHTAARLDIGGQTFYGKNAHKRNIDIRVNARSRDQAEADVFQQAKNAGVKAREATMYLDRDLCGSCGAKGGVGSLMRGIGLERLTVHSPSGRFRITAKRPSVPRPF